MGSPVDLEVQLPEFLGGDVPAEGTPEPEPSWLGAPDPEEEDGDLDVEDPDLTEEDPFKAQSTTEDADSAEDKPETEEPTKDDPKTKTVPYTRFAKAIQDRNQLREEIADLKGSVSAYEEFFSTLNKKYAEFKNPASQLAWDADFADTATKLSKTDNEVAKAIQKVVSAMNGQKPDTTPAQPAAAEAPKSDPRVERLLEKEARRVTNDVLKAANVKSAMREVMADYVVGRTDDIAGLTEKSVKTLVREFMKEKGFSLEDVLTKTAAKKTTDAPAKPNTGGKAGLPAATKKADQAEEPKFKSRQEFLEHRKAKLETLFSELSAQ